MTNNKIQRITLVGIAFLLLASLSACAQKKTIQISTHQVINAPVKEVYDLLVQLKRFPEWSPFMVTDPNQKNYVTGENGKLGSTFHWDGVDEKSKGFQTLAAMDKNTYVRMECTIQKPFEGNPVFEYRIAGSDGSVELLQDFTLHLSGFDFFMTKLFGVKSKMIKTNKLGLERLKALLEKK